MTTTSGQAGVSPNRHPEAPRLTATFAILLTASCGMACLMALLPAAGHDQMWLLYAARQVLTGKTLYGPELFESNPPLIVWLSALPEALAQASHVPDTTVGKLFTLVVAGASGALCLHLLRRSGRPVGRVGLLGLAFAYVTIACVLPVRDFGQRDHLLWLLLLPYVFAAAVRASGRTLPPFLAAAIGALALGGVALKPHQALVFVAVEAYLLLTCRTRAEAVRRLFRPETLSLTLCGLLYLAAVRAFAPLYFQVVMPVVRLTYWAYGSLGWQQLIAQSVQLHVLAAAVGALLLRLGWQRASHLARLLALSGVACLLGFYLQGTGWFYQQLPALGFFALALVFLSLDFAGDTPWTPPRWTPAAAAILSIIALALTAYATDFPFTPERRFPIDQPDPSFFADLPPGTPVMTISTSVDDVIQPLFKFHLTLAQRYPHFLLLPAILRWERPAGRAPAHPISAARLAELDRLQHIWMVDDLRRWQPHLILVERCEDPAVACQELEDRHDNLLAFFLRDPKFARLFAGYHLWRRAGAYDAYLRNDRNPYNR